MKIIEENKLNMTLLRKGILKPELYEKSSDKFWDDEYISEQMLRLHLDPDVESASKSRETVEAEADFIIRSTGMGPGKSVLDLGCGPGLYVREFAKTGAVITGVDLSGRSIGFADENIKPKFPNTNFIKMNYLDMDFIKAFDVVTLIFYDFCVLSVNEQKTLLAKIRAALKDGGVLILDIVTEHMKQPAAESTISVCEGGFWSEKPYLEILNSYLYADPKTLGQQYMIIEKDGSARIIRFYNRLFSLTEITELMNETGFNIINIFNNLKGDALCEDSETYGIIAKKAEFGL
jgi:2-polyprenyl-3-methyl-5-hydroxy-6-metoxy-1,4-benzoquinol methylase